MVRHTRIAISPFQLALAVVFIFLVLASRNDREGFARSPDSPYEKIFLLIQEERVDEAISLLNKIIKNTPNDRHALTLLGTLYYKRDQLSEAITAWEKVIQVDPENKGVQASLDKARREIATQSRFTHEMTRHFTIKFDGAENRALYQTVLGILEDAYGEVGRALHYFPVEEVIVYLYTDQQFFDVTRAPAWSGGIFDGKIRIPSKGFENKMDALKKILTHEYVHAVVYQMTQHVTSKKGGRPVQVPTWLNEGIAQYLELSGTKGEVNQRMKGRIKQGIFIKLDQLHGSFMGLNGAQAAIAYEESLSAVSFLVDEFGMWRVKMLLEDLASKGNIDEAIGSALLISYDTFQSRWEASLQ